MKIDIDINESYKETRVIVRSREMNDEVTEILDKLKDRPKTITGRRNQEIYIIGIEDILIIYAQNNKVYVSTLEGVFEIKHKLYEIEEQLTGSTFVRISKSSIVNSKGIKNIEIEFNGSLVVRCLNDQTEIISRRYIKSVKEFLGIGGK